MAVTVSVGALVWRFACVLFGGGPLCVLSYIHTLLRLRRRARTLAPLPYLALIVLACVGYLLLFLCPWACGMCVLWRWCAVRWRVAPPSRLRAGVPHTILLSAWTA